MATKVIVQLPAEQDYAVRIGGGVIGDLGRNMRAVERLANVRDALVVTDENVGPLYVSQVRNSLSSVGFKVADIVVPAGEEAKSIDIASEVWSAMASLGLGRDCVVVALGGGVVGDLSGFVASTYQRGVALVQVPTTLLAQVDSSVGGKTAVNIPEGKNLVGTFYQPLFVCADADTLATLPEREWRCGCAEIAKSAIIDSDDFFFWLFDQAQALANRDADVSMEAVKRCIVFKAGVVARDKTESAGIRECLNYGHTFGHALELVAGYGTFSHGAAVAEGIRFAARLAQSLGRTAPDFAQAQEALLDALGLPALSWRAPVAEMLEGMKRDKKTRGGEVRFVLASDVGQWDVVSVPDDVISRQLQQWYYNGTR